MTFVFSACGAENLMDSLGGGRNSNDDDDIHDDIADDNIQLVVPIHRPVDDPLRAAVEILPDRLYYIALNSQPRRRSTSHDRPLHYFQIDTELLYWNFFLDFGPLNLGQLYRFAYKLNRLLKEYKDHIIVFYSSSESAKRANATYLIAAWQILYLDRTPEQAMRGFTTPATTTTTASQQQQQQKSHHKHKSTKSGGTSSSGGRPSSSSSATTAAAAAALVLKNSSAPPQSLDSLTTKSLIPFHDASPIKCTYDLTVMDCLRGLMKARNFGFFDFHAFDVQEYEYFEQVENGDLNWIIQDRILAFAGPHFRRNVSPEGYCTLTPADYIPYFKKKKVDLVVRLNKRCYDEEEFRKADIRHVEEYYLDGSCPPMNILDRVVDAFETVPTDKAFAVHCKAGLGRTGTCIGAYIMKHYKFTAAEVIGWMRICRPGMVIGPQQHFLQDIQERMWHEGSVVMLKPTQDMKFLHIAESERKDKGSPKSVVMGHQSSSSSALCFGNLMPDHDDDDDHHHDPSAKTGRDGQAEGLLARRNQKQTSSIFDK